MWLGIEIGGTKLQLGIGDGCSPRLERLERREVVAESGAQGILATIEPIARELIAQFAPCGVGVGFGGPVEGRRVIKSHHVAGWDAFPLADWFQEKLGLSATLVNDADAAALAEATLGAGRGASPVLYVTVGTGIGAGLVVDGRLYRGYGPAAMELGHLRPSPEHVTADQNLESLAAGWGIAAEAARLAADADASAAQRGVTTRSPTTRELAEAAANGDRLAIDVIARARRALAWGLAQAITLLSPQVIVVGGGVSLMDERLFWRPLADELRGYVFPPLADCYELRRPELGEEVVVHGAVLAAALSADSGDAIP